MTQPKRIAILTGGGDVPGLNNVIKSVVYETSQSGYEVLGIRRGWEGLTHMKPGRDLDPEYVRVLDRMNTRGIDRTGGTVLHTSRTNPSRMKQKGLPRDFPADRLPALQTGPESYDFTPVVLENLQALGVEALFAIGGDDTLSFAKTLDSKGFHVIGIPKTMDNDVRGTEYCIGFSTAITRAKDMITRQRTTLGSHERIGVFRIFGRDAGFTALFTAYVTSGRCVIPEAEFDIGKLVDVLAEDKRKNPSRYSFVIASEGAMWTGGSVSEYGEADAFGHRKKVDVGQALSDEIKRRAGEETINSDLTYDLRSGEPDSFDHMIAITFAGVAVDLLRQGKFGQLVGIRDGKYSYCPLPDPKLGPRKVDIQKLYNVERFRPNYLGKIGVPFMLTLEND
jgi:ATP-dependent phosphofructokinase / diphosphate-dependent phosphofructokinase